jgi:hypothetical protein
LLPLQILLHLGLQGARLRRLLFGGLIALEGFAEIAESAENAHGMLTPYWSMCSARNLQEASIFASSGLRGSKFMRKYGMAFSISAKVSALKVQRVPLLL